MIHATWSSLTRVVSITLLFTLLCGAVSFSLYAAIGQLCSRLVCCPAGDDLGCNLEPEASSDFRCLPSIAGAHTERVEQGDSDSREEPIQHSCQPLGRRRRGYPCTRMGHHCKLITKTCAIILPFFVLCVSLPIVVIACLWSMIRWVGHKILLKYGTEGAFTLFLIMVHRSLCFLLILGAQARTFCG